MVAQAQTASSILAKLTKVMVCTLMYHKDGPPTTEMTLKPPPPPKTKPGTYTTFPSIPRPPKPPTPHAIPLNHIKYRATIHGGLAKVTLLQNYTNPENEPINLHYQFPISSTLVFHSFKAHYKDTVIVGKVKEKKQAKKEFQENLDKGNTVAYADIFEHARDVMQLKLGNFPAKETIVIELAYIMRLDVFEYSRWSFRIPSTLTPRYLSQDVKSLPDFKQAVKKYPTYWKFTTEKAYDWQIDVKVDWPGELAKVESLTHADVVDIKRSGLGSAEVKFKKGKPQYPDKDFELILTDKDSFGTRAEVARFPGELKDPELPRFGAMIQFIPDFYQWAMTPLQGTKVLDKVKLKKREVEFLMSTTEAEFVFILDRSGSMSGRRIQNAKNALISFLESIPENSKFNVVSFGSSHSLLYPEAVQKTKEVIKDAEQKISKFKADMGGTEMYRAFQAATSLERTGNNQRIIFMLTDGNIGRQEIFLKKVERDCFFSRARLFMIGIGNGVSTYLIEKAAEVGNGKSLLISDNKDPTERILTLLKESLTPSITDFMISFDTKYMFGIAPIPQGSAHVIKGEPFMIYILFKHSLEKTKERATKVSLSYYDSADRVRKRKEFEIRLDRAVESDVPFRMFAKEFTEDELRDFQNSYIDQGLVAKEEKREEFAKEMGTRLGVGYQVVVPKYTAFICVIDEGKGKAEKDVEVPNLESADHGGRSGVRKGKPRPKGLTTFAAGGAMATAMATGVVNTAAVDGLPPPPPPMPKPMAAPQPGPPGKPVKAESARGKPRPKSAAVDETKDTKPKADTEKSAKPPSTGNGKPVTTKDDTKAKNEMDKEPQGGKGKKWSRALTTRFVLLVLFGWLYRQNLD